MRAVSWLIIWPRPDQFLWNRFVISKVSESPSFTCILLPDRVQNHSVQLWSRPLSEEIVIWGDYSSGVTPWHPGTQDYSFYRQRSRTSSCAAILPPGEPSHGFHDFPQTVELHPLSSCHGHGLKSTVPCLQTLYCTDATLLWDLQEIGSGSSGVCNAAGVCWMCLVTSASPSSSAVRLSFRRHRVWRLSPSPQVMLQGELSTMTSCSGSTSEGRVEWRRSSSSSNLVVFWWVILWWRIFKKSEDKEGFNYFSFGKNQLLQKQPWRQLCSITTVVDRPSLNCFPWKCH